MWQCSSCGEKILPPPYAGYSDLSYEFCGPCNNRYYQEKREEEEREEEDRRRRGAERWNNLVSKYGIDVASEIIADGG